MPPCSRTSRCASRRFIPASLPAKATRQPVRVRGASSVASREGSVSRLRSDTLLPLFVTGTCLYMLYLCCKPCERLKNAICTFLCLVGSHFGERGNTLARLSLSDDRLDDFASIIVGFHGI